MNTADSLAKLLTINTLLAKLVDGENLTTQEAEELIYNIFAYDNEGMHFATFVGAIHAKGETADELTGFVNATKRLAVQFNASKFDASKTTDLSGTGGGTFKSFNISTAASLVVAAAGYTVAKAAYYGVTSPTGSADMFTEFGVDFLELTSETVENALEKVGICPIILPFISPNMTNRSKLSRKFFVERQVKVRTPFHLASNICSPLTMTHRIYGCYSPKYLKTLAELFVKQGYKRTLTFYAEVGQPEMSNVSNTLIVEQNGEEIKQYSVKPSELGVKQADKKDIETGGKEQNITDFLAVLQGKATEPKIDITALNAGAALYALEDVSSIKEGTEKAKQILIEGRPYQLFEKLIAEIGQPELLEARK